VKVEIETLNPPSRAGVRGTLVVQERVTELLEVEALMARVRNGVAIEHALAPVGTETIHGR
jgi:hypothetical protein